MKEQNFSAKKWRGNGTCSVGSISIASMHFLTRVPVDRFYLGSEGGDIQLFDFYIYIQLSRLQGCIVLMTFLR